MDRGIFIAVDASDGVPGPEAANLCTTSRSNCRTRIDASPGALATQAAQPKWLAQEVALIPATDAFESVGVESRRIDAARAAAAWVLPERAHSSLGATTVVWKA